jgi:intein/homing endonuclease
MGSGKIGEIKPPSPLLELGQFYQRDRNVYCFNPDCNVCRWKETCQHEEVTIKVGPGTNIRKSFIARDGFYLAAIDYKQIEIRVAAQLSGEPIWINAFQRNLDLHTQMARIGWKIPESQEVPKHIRDAAKCCLIGEHRILTPNGYRRLDSFHPTESGRLYTQATSETFQKILNQGKRSVRKLQTELSPWVIGTPNHQVRAWNPEKGAIEWRRLDELEKGDLLVKRTSTPVTLIEGGSNLLGWEMLGWLYGNGSYQGQRHSVLNFSEDEVGTYNSWKVTLKELEVPHSSWVSTNNQRCIQIIEWDKLLPYPTQDLLGLHTQWEYRRIPDVLYSLGRSQIAAYLRGLISSNGSYGRRATFNTQQPALANDYRELIQLLGIVTTLTVATRGPDFRKPETQYQVSLSGRFSAQLFTKLIGFTSPQKTLKHQKLMEGEWGNCPTELNLIKAQKVNLKDWELWKEMGWTLDPVCSVEDYGEAVVYDPYEVSGDHSYLSAGLIHHNCNFGNLFLGSPHTLARQSSLTLPEAVAAHKIWWDTVKVYKQWTERQIAYYKTHKCVWTFFKRKREMSEIVKTAEEKQKKSGNKSGWGFCDRTSVNSPIQGCLRPEVKVLTSIGYVSIGKLWELQEAGKDLPEVWTGNRFATFQVLNRGKARYVNLHLKGRGYLACDNRHRLKRVTKTGWQWVHISDLVVGDKIAIARPVKAVTGGADPQKERIYLGKDCNAKILRINPQSNEWAYILGFLIGDGFFGRNDSNYWIECGVSGDPQGIKIARNLENAFREIGLDTEPRWVKRDIKKNRFFWNITCEALGEALQEAGIVPNCEAPDKTIPEDVFQLPESSRIEFLKGLFGTDGAETLNDSGWYSPSYTLVKDLYLLLRSLGVDSLFSETVDGTWKLDIVSKTAFASLLDLPPREKKYNEESLPVLPFQAEAIYQVLKGKDLTRSDQVIRSRLRGRGSVNFKTALRILGDSEVDELHLYAEVQAVDSPEEMGDTFTLSVDDHFHQFDSEGVISKNTAADLMKLGMIRVGRWIRSSGLQDDIKILLTVHDELVLEIRDTPQMYEQLREVGRQMISTPKGKSVPDIQGWFVPLGVDIEIGKNWAEMTDIDKLDPTTKDTVVESKPPDDTVVLIVQTLTQEQSDSLLGLLARACAVPNVIKVPLKLQIGGKLHRSGAMSKVHRPTLEEGIKRIPGVAIKSE